MTPNLKVTIASDLQPCGGCGQSTKIRVGGVAGHWGCIARPDEPTPAAGAKIRFLADLEGEYAPKRRDQAGKMRGPWWRPPMADITDLVQTSAWSWKRPYSGQVAVLDRSGAWIAAASSVVVAHGSLRHTGPARQYIGPGFYKVPVCQWTERGMPHPLGGAALNNTPEVWVPHPRAELLWRLAKADRWPEFEAVDTWTNPDGVRLDKWTTHVNKVRSAAISRHGRDSELYDAIKTGFSQAVSLMIGTREAGRPRTFKSAVQRPDWAYAIQDHAAVTLWCWADDCSQVAAAAGRPRYAPVGMRAVDELLVPVEAVDLLSTTERSGGRRPLRLDPTGTALGTFKLKATEVWE